MMTTASAQGQSLSALQARMQAHVLHGDEAALLDVCDDHGLSAPRRLGIYHHAYRARLLETMRDTFAHTWRYLGDEWFDHLALAFIEQDVCTHANLRWYGAHWPVWLSGDRLSQLNLGAHPEVAELAQMDWALRHAFDAEDQRALSAADLSRLPADQWVQAPLCPQASVALLSLKCNTLALWHALDQDDEVPPAIELPQGLAVLVWRQDERPHFRSLSGEEAQALTQLMLGRSFADICALLAPSQAEADAATTAASILRRWLTDGVLTRSPSMIAG